MPRSTNKNTGLVRDVAIIAAVLLAIPLTVLAIVYALALKHDVSYLKGVNDKLLTQVNQQRQLTVQQREIASQQLEVNQSMLSISQQQLDITKEMLQTAQAANSKLDSSLTIQQQLLGIAQATLQQARDINRKMPPPVVP